MEYEKLKKLPLKQDIETKKVLKNPHNKSFKKCTFLPLACT